MMPKNKASSIAMNKMAFFLFNILFCFLY